MKLFSSKPREPLPIAIPDDEPAPWVQGQKNFTELLDGHILFAPAEIGMAY